MMKKVRGLGKGFFILSALLLMFAVVGCDDSDSTERIGADTDEESVAVGVNTETWNSVAIGQTITADDLDGDADAEFSARVATGAGANVTIQTGDYDTSFSDEFDEAFDEGAGDGNRWQVAGFARIGTDNPISLDTISLTMPGSVVVNGRTLSDWVASGLKPTVRFYDEETDTWSIIDSDDIDLTSNADGTVTVSYVGVDDIEFTDGDIVAVMGSIDDVDVDLTATTPDNNCDVIVTARVDDSDYNVTDVTWWTISPLSWGDTTVLADDRLRLNGVVSGDDRVRVHVRSNVFYSSGTNSDVQTVERIFSIRCETGSGGVTF